MPDFRESQYVGSVVGLAVGDAMGYPAEFRRRAQLVAEIGPDGITDFIAIKDPRFSRPFFVGADHLHDLGKRLWRNHCRRA